MKNLKLKILRFNEILFIGFILLSSISCRSDNTEDMNLKTAFKNYFLIGAALNLDQIFEKDKTQLKIIDEQFNSITAENILKWEHVHPELNKYDFEPADKFVSLGEKKNMFTVGHVLIWHNQTPSWVYEHEDGRSLDREQLLDRMKDHIYTVVERYKGKIKGWDVVNEALEDDGSIRESEWMKIIGEDYIAKAFEFANQADPSAELYYNDFSLENAPKRNGAIELIKKLKANGFKVDGVGLQGHYKMDWPTSSRVDSTIKAFAALGVKVMITELDVDVLPYDFQNYSADINFRLEEREELNPYKNGLPDSVQKSFTTRYTDLFKVFVENKDAVSRVTFWGVTDKESWLNYWPIGGRTNYPLLFDREGKVKPVYEAVINLVKKD